MKKQLLTRFSIVVVLVLLTLGAAQPPLAAGPLPSDVPVEVFASVLAQHKELATNTIVEIVKGELDAEFAQGPYLKAQVDVLFDGKAVPSILIVYLLRSDTYLVEAAKITLGANYEVTLVEKNYTPQDTERTEAIAPPPTCPDPTIQVLLSTCTTEFPTAVEGVNTSYDYAVSAGYTARKLLGTEENTTAIKNWLSCPNLLYWGRIGHGSTTGILLSDATLSYTYFNTLQPSGLNDKALYFNSCQVFNNPLRSSILGAGADKFIGGICNLLIGPSEEVFKCWNNHNFNHHAPPGGVSDAMCYWSQQCEVETSYPSPGCHGCGGPGLTFPMATPTIDNAQFVSQNVPTTLQTGEQQQVSITMKNAGTTTWTRAGGYKLGSQNPQDNTLWTGSSRILLPPGVSVEPGQNYTFIFSITAPSTPGTYGFQWRMVQEGVHWFGDYTPNVGITVVAPAIDNAQFVSQNVPLTLQPGEHRQVSIKMKNNGTTTWTRAGGYKLGTQNPQDNTLWTGGTRILLSSTDSIGQGQSKTFTFDITAPTTPGTYDFQWRMVREGIHWFGGYTPNVEITVSCPGTAHKWQSDYYGQPPYQSPIQPNPSVCLNDDRCLYSSGGAADHGTVNGVWVCSWDTLEGRSQGAWYQCEATRANANKVIEGYECQLVGGNYAWIPVR